MQDYENEFPAGKVIAQFSADWCGPCKVLKPRMSEIVDNTDVVTGILVNIDENQDLTNEFNVLSVPTVIILEDGKEVSRHVGLPSLAAVNEYISEQ